MKFSLLKLFSFTIVSFSCNLYATLPLHVTQQQLAGQKENYTSYLKKLSQKLSNTPSFIRDAYAKNVMNLTQAECDAIPVSYPFLCEKKYASLLSQFTNEKILDIINQLLDAYHIKTALVSSLRKKEEILHQLLHEYNCFLLNLPIATTTKQLASLVEKKKIDITKLCEAQLAEFFIKFLLEYQ